jgi:hypothetical protein
MSALDGKWEVTVNSPMGQQKITMELATAGGVLSGTMTGAMGSAPISGTADGDSFSFASNITTGSVKTQGFGTFPMKGERA